MFLFRFFLLFSMSCCQASEIIFTVHNEVIQSDIEPFTATVPAFGNGNRLSDGGGFEPIVFRTMLQATADAKNTIYATPKALTYYDSWKEGLLDGASVEVLRIENGKFRSIRQSTVRKGGHLASGWVPQFSGKVIPGDVNHIKIKLEPHNKADATYFYTVRAVDNDGGLSEPAHAISLTPPAINEPLNSDVTFRGPPKSFDQSQIKPPAGLRIANKNDESATLAWKHVSDATGYIVYRSDYPPSKHKGYALVLNDDGPDIKAQDLVIIRHKFYNPTKANTLTNRVWRDIRSKLKFTQPMLGEFNGEPSSALWQLEPHPNTSKVPNKGETYLSADVTPSRPLTVGKATHSGTSQLWYEVFNPEKSYIFEVWLRGKGELNAQAHLPDKTVKLPITDTWQKYTYKFTAPELYTDDSPRWIELEITGNGHVDVDNFRLFEAHTPYLALLPEDLTALRESGMGFLRTHGFIKTKQKTYDLNQLTNTAGLINGTLGNTLPQAMAQIAASNSAPWLQIEPHFSASEWLGLAEFLAAPYDPAIDSQDNRPWAAKRYAAGHKKPYTDLFETIRFELGNETWNRLFAPWVFPDMIDGNTNQFYSRAKTYGLYQEYVLTILKQSPYWPNLKDTLQPVIGGWTINSYGETAAAMSHSTPLVTVAEYNGGWDQDEAVVTDTPEGYASLFSFATQTAKQRAAKHINRANEIAKQRGTPLMVGTYEAGPGYVRNGLNNARVTEKQYSTQEQVMKSVAAGTATLDTFLTQMREGYKTQNYFLFKRSDYWASHAKWYRGGQPYPAWLWLSLLNNNGGEGLGDLLYVESENVPTKNFPQIARRKPLVDAPMVDVFPFNNGNVWTIIVISRISADTSNKDVSPLNITIELPIEIPANITEWTMTGNYKTSNANAYDAQLIKHTLKNNGTVRNQLAVRALKPGSVRVIQFNIDNTI